MHESIQTAQSLVATLEHLTNIAIAIGGVLVSCVVWLFTVSTSVKQLKVDNADLKEHMKTDTSELRSRITGVETDHNGTKVQVAEIKVNIQNINQNIVATREDMREIKGYILGTGKVNE
jgi:septal ring factor EnvC (AmiA/AmiB activator)